MADDTPATPDRWLARELASYGLLVGVIVLMDPVQRRNARAALDRALRSARHAMAGPQPRPLHPWETAQLHDEVRRITREAAPDG